ncbi:hypothetical protein HQ586_00745 [Candidatus Bathyarchaeota archaeon]|nr:hypothetical protein [Candidatus Bathyarchaeota archaeon]
MEFDEHFVQYHFQVRFVEPPTCADDDSFFNKCFEDSLNGVVSETAISFHHFLYVACAIVTVAYKVGYPEFIFIVCNFVEGLEGEV